MLTVSRRSYLLSATSSRIMRAAGAAASPKAMQATGMKLAMKQFAALAARQDTPEAQPLYLPQSLYDQASQAGYDMRGLAKTPTVLGS